MKEYYYYSFTFEQLTDNRTQIGNCYRGLSINKVTHKIIQEAKVYAKMDKDSVLISCSFLGKMTKDEFGGEKI